jgi:hypothetical protein
MARIPHRVDAGRPAPTRAEQAQKRAVLAELDRSGWFVRGSLLEVANRCGTPGCRCKADPPQLHGPYWQWSRKVAGKTVSVRLTDAQAELVRGWIANAKLVDRQLAELDQVVVQVTERILAAIDR